ncbi:MAG TPA: hypothetical protein DD789_06195 [Firmicutes bacterium]|nr:hypothetical protein [Bacillota bacterium]
MENKRIEIDPFRMRIITMMVPICLMLLISLFFSILINNEKRLLTLAARLEQVETTLTEIAADLELVREVFDEAQKIKSHIEQRSKIHPEQATEVTYALLYCAAAKQLNPYLLLAIAETESSFYRHAVGGVGERGLVQVRYGTFKMMMKTGDFNHWRDTLEAGANYMVYLLNRFKGNTILALAGYNAGPNRTRERLMAIGSPYVKKVERNYARIVRNNESVASFYGRDLISSGWSSNV